RGRAGSGVRGLLKSMEPNSRGGREKPGHDPGKLPDASTIGSAKKSFVACAQSGLRAHAAGIRACATLMVSSAATAASDTESCMSSASSVRPDRTKCELASKNEYSHRRFPSPRRYTG